MTKWWESNSYTEDYGLHPQLTGYAGPKGVAVVRAFKDGRTDPGWSKNDFMKNYLGGAFNKLPYFRGFELDKWALAYVMRSVRLVCIDIDGKNNGHVGVGGLGMLPPTLAETSKSGDGYHLFYSLPSDTWDDDYGFAEIGDRVGIEEGVDIRGIGCVFHHSQQRWNGLPVAALPAHLHIRLTTPQQGSQTIDTIIDLLTSGDPTEVALMRRDLLAELAKPIRPGKRNLTLFAIGAKLAAAAVPNWEAEVEARALTVGLGMDEAQKLVRNIRKYGANA